MESAYFMMILMLGVLCPVLATNTNCPPQNQTGFCECDDDGDKLNVKCSNPQIGEFSMDDLKKFLHVFNKSRSMFLELDSLELGTVPSVFFEGLNIWKLAFESCGLDRLAEEGLPALSGLEDTLEVIFIDESLEEKNVPAKLDLSHLRHLSSLYLQTNSITEISDDWFAHGPPQLEDLTITSNGIKRLGENAFGNLGNLQILSIDNNRFGEMTRSMLPGPKNNLTFLSLHDNALTTLPDNFFTGMPSLKYLAIQDNRLVRFHRSTFEPIWEQMRTIYLDRNPLDCSDLAIQWMVRWQTNASISGTCETPPERKGMELEDLIKSRRSRLIQLETNRII